MDFYVCDMNYFPFYRVRKVTTIQIPYKKNSLGDIITLIQTLLTVRRMMKESLINLEAILQKILSNDVDDDITIHSDSGSDNEIVEMNDTFTDDDSFISIKTQITPKRISK